MYVNVDVNVNIRMIDSFNVYVYVFMWELCSHCVMKSTSDTS
jgi:hypothetical protein